MHVVIIDNGSTYISDVEDLFSEYDTDIISYNQLGNHKISDETLLVLSGGHNFPVLWHENEYKTELNYIKNHKGPIIGICLGFQLIAHAYGSHLHLLARRRHGKLSLTAIGDSRLLGDSTHVTVYESHHWSVQNVHDPLIALAKSVDGIEILKHKEKPIYGVQFHPEKDHSGHEIIQNILTRFG